MLSRRVFVRSAGVAIADAKSASSTLGVSMRWISSGVSATSGAGVRGAVEMNFELREKMSTPLDSMDAFSRNSNSSFKSTTASVTTPIMSLATAPTNSMFRRAAMSAASMPAVGTSVAQLRCFSTTNGLLFNRRNDQLEQAKSIQERPPEEEKEKDEDEEEEDDGKDAKPGYLPFPAPFHTINIISIMFVANILIYALMKWAFDDDQRDFMVEHFTCSHENWWKIYPIFTSTLYQENAFQMIIDCWLLWQFGSTVLEFMGEGRMAMFWAMSAVGGAIFHVGRQYFELHYGLDELEVRGRCFGPNPFILGLVSVEGLVFRHLNFIQSPPVPFLVMTAFVMIIDVWRIFTTKPEEHGASTGGALVAYLFWLLPARFYGLDRLTAAM